MIIVTDSAVDMPKEEIKQLGIQVAPLLIQFPEGEVSSESIGADEFYNRLKAIFPHIPSTSQPSAGFFTKLYEKLAALKEEVLSVHISSGLSGTIESARLGASHVKDASISLFDSLTLSGGERFQVKAAALAARAGWKKAAILERLEKIRASTEVVFTLDTLTYLAKGGRIGRVEALAGSLLKIKPVICVDKADGKYNTVSKERTISRSLDAIYKHLSSMYGPEVPLWVSVMHGQMADQADRLSELLREKLNVARLEVLRVSPVLGVHTGPGVVGAAAVPMRYLEDLE